MYKCTICQKEYKTFASIAQHYGSKHHISKEQYWEFHFPERKKCLACGKPTPLRKRGADEYYYQDTCSITCRNSNNYWKESKKYAISRMSEETRAEQLRKRRETCLKKYGHSNNWNSDFQKKRAKEIAETRTKEEWQKIKELTWRTKRTKTYNKLMTHQVKPNFSLEYFIAMKKTDIVSWKCSVCNFEQKRQVRSSRRLKCPSCNPPPGISKGEKELLNYVKRIYNGQIIENERNLMNELSLQHEIDIYLPEKKLAIEYNGTYWHCDPRIYSKDFYNKNKKKYAHELWERDKQKKEILESRGIQVIYIWEEDWNKSKFDIQEKLKTIIN